MAANDDDDDEIVVTDAMRRAVAREDCARGGHNLEVVVTFSGAPTRVFCERCGLSWAIGR